MKKIILLLAVAASIQSCSIADGSPVSVSADSLFKATHTKSGYGRKGKKYNSDMKGKGLTFHKGDNEGIRYGLSFQNFTNSYDKETNAIAPSVDYCWKDNIHFCAGGLIAFNDGYDTFAAPALTTEIGYGRVSVGSLITGTEDHKALAVGFFARFRAYQW